MKTLHPSLFAALAATALAADDPATPAAPAASGNTDCRIHVELNVLTIPEKDAVALLPLMRDETKMPDAWTKLEALIASGTAHILAAPGATTRAEENIDLKEGDEVKYPIEWESPYIVEPPDNGTKQSKPLTATGQTIAFPATTFESRFTGIEFKSFIVANADGQVLTLNTTASHTRLLRWDEYESARLPSGEKISLKVPYFGVMSDQANTVMLSGERALLGIHRLPAEKPGTPPEMELFILHAWSTPLAPIKK